MNDAIAAAAEDLGVEVRCEQHSGEGEIVDALHAARTNCDGIVINPGAYAHYSYAIADAIAAIRIPVSRCTFPISRRAKPFAAPA